MSAARRTDNPDALATLAHDGPLAYRSQLPLASWAQQLRSAGIPAQVSFHAGTYLCNALLYLSLHLAQRRGLRTQAAFILSSARHVPGDRRADESARSRPLYPPKRFASSWRIWPPDVVNATPSENRGGRGMSPHNGHFSRDFSLRRLGWPTATTMRAMNYYAHGWRFVAQPLLPRRERPSPDWLNVVDRQGPQPEAAREPDGRFEPRGRRRGAGDRAAPRRRRLVPPCSRLPRADVAVHRRVRTRLPDDDGLRPSFLGHILVELLLDSALIVSQPAGLDVYHRSVESLDPELVRHTVERISGRELPSLPRWIPRFCSERFLYDYQQDGKLLARLNAVMLRVGLRSLPESLLDWFPEARRAFRSTRTRRWRTRAAAGPAATSPTTLVRNNLLKTPLLARNLTHEIRHEPVALDRRTRTTACCRCSKCSRSWATTASRFPLFNLEPENYAAWGKQLDDLGLARTAVTVRGADDNPISPDAAVARQGHRQRPSGRSIAARRPAPTTLVGPYHSALGRLQRPRPDGRRMEMGRREHAARWPSTPARSSVTLGVEYLNRFECYLLNTARRRRPVRPRSEPPELPHDVRHVPRQHRRKEHRRRRSTPAPTCCATFTSPKTTAARPARATSAGTRTSTRSGKSATTAGWWSRPLAWPCPNWPPPPRSGGACSTAKIQLARDSLAFMRAEVAKRWKA